MTRATAHLRRPARAARGAARRAVRGAMAVTGVLWLMVAVICLMAIDVGHVAWQQRELQKLVDLAATAGAGGEQGSCVSSIQANAASNGFVQGRDRFVDVADPARGTLTDLGRMCGRWDPRTVAPTAATAPGRPSQFFEVSADAATFNAARVTVRRTVPYLFVFGLSEGEGSRTLEASATAARATPLAALNIRSTLATVDASRSQLLNALFGGLLGGTLDLSLGSWNGLVNTQINLLDYLDALAIELGVAAGNYQQLLQTDAEVGVLLGVAAQVLQAGGGTAQATVDAVAGLLGLQAAVPAGAPLLKLGELIEVQSGTAASGLDLGLQAMQLAQGIVQAANGKNGLVAELNSSLLGLTSARVNVKVIEPPQISAIGNPALARINPTGADQIYVRTAQVRTLISVDLPALTGLSSLLNGITSALSGVTSVLNSVLALDLRVLGDVLSCVLACTRDVTDIDVLPPPVRVDIGLDVGHGQSRVTDYRCDAAEQSLTTSTRTALADIRLGKMGTTAELAKTAAFSSSVLPSPSVVPVLDIGAMQCTRVLLGLIPVQCNESGRRAFLGGGLGLLADVPVAATSATQQFINPPKLNEALVYQSISSQNIVSSLQGTLAGLDLLRPMPPDAAAESPALGSLLTGLTNALSGVIGTLRNVVSNLLSPLLDPLLNTLLKGLGVDLAQTEVAGRLSCAGSVELVY